MLVTGAGGFVGSHLTERLVELGAKTLALVRYRSDGSWGWLDESQHRKEIEVLRGDIRDFDSVKKAMAGVEVVFHLAALISIPYSYEAPQAYVRTNVEGTLNVAQAARELGTRRIVHTSTSEVYGTARYVPIDEAHPLQAQSPYSATKMSADKLVESFFNSFRLPVVILRPFNTFGPRQSARAVIPAIITQALTNDKVRLGSLTPTRDFNYVSNTVDGFIAAAVAPDAIGRTINIGSGREISINDLVNIIGKMLGKGIAVESDEVRLRPEASEVGRLLAHNGAAREFMGWHPAVSLEDGLEMTIEWLRSHLSAYRPSDYLI